MKRMLFRALFSDVRRKGGVMGSTKIEWADAVWNPVTGCTKVSAGCANCYAERTVNRFGGRVHDAEFGEVICYSDRLDQPLHWRKPRRVFVCSMGDLFHEDVPDRFRDLVFAAMALSPQHTFIVLTKRPQTMFDWFSYSGASRVRADRVSEACVDHFYLDADADDPTYPWPIPNVWLGVSVEDQRAADERIPLLLKTPAAVRFVSVEPMLGPVDLRRAFGTNGPRQTFIEQLDWVICGGESGPRARPMNPAWPRALRDQCVVAGVPFSSSSGGNTRQ